MCHFAQVEKVLWIKPICHVLSDMADCMFLVLKKEIVMQFFIEISINIEYITTRSNTIKHFHGPSAREKIKVVSLFDKIYSISTKKHLFIVTSILFSGVFCPAVSETPESSCLSVLMNCVRGPSQWVPFNYIGRLITAPLFPFFTLNWRKNSWTEYKNILPVHRWEIKRCQK